MDSKTEKLFAKAIAATKKSSAKAGGASSNYQSAIKRINEANSVEALKRLEKSFERIYNAGQFTPSELAKLDTKIMEKIARLGIHGMTSANWSPDFFDAETARSFGDRRYKYVPYHMLPVEYRMIASAMYPYSYGGKYKFKDEHYYYPLTKNNKLPTGRARRVLAIPRAILESPAAMKKLGYKAEKAAKVPTAKTNLKQAEAFFYKHAGYSYGPGETATQGRKRGAKALAQAEAHANKQGWEVKWEEDVDSYSLAKDEPDVSEWLSAVLYDEKGKVLASLGGIGDPDKNYSRVVEAELALEAMNS